MKITLTLTTLIAKAVNLLTVGSAHGNDAARSKNLDLSPITLDLKKTSPMKLSIFATATLLGLSLVPPTHAQLTSPIQGHIPFAFQVGDTVLPAGTYVVSSLSTTNPEGVLTLYGLGQKKGKTIMFSTGVAQAISGQNTKLVFHRYGSTYFLSQVWQGFGQNGNQLPLSKAERVTARQMAADTKPRTVEFASVAFSRIGE